MCKLFFSKFLNRKKEDSYTSDCEEVDLNTMKNVLGHVKQHESEGGVRTNDPYFNNELAKMNPKRWNYLVKKGLIHIDQGCAHITEQGRNLLKKHSHYA